MPELVKIFFITVVIMLAFLVIFFMAYSFLYPEEPPGPPGPPKPPGPPGEGYYLAVEYEGIRYYLGERNSIFSLQTELPSEKFYGENGEEIKYGNLFVYYNKGGNLTTSAGDGPVRIMFQSVIYGGGFWLLTTGPCSVYWAISFGNKLVTKEVFMITNPVSHCFLGSVFYACGSKELSEKAGILLYKIYFAKLVD